MVLSSCILCHFCGTGRNGILLMHVNKSPTVTKCSVTRIHTTVAAPFHQIQFGEPSSNEFTTASLPLKCFGKPSRQYISLLCWSIIVLAIWSALNPQLLCFTKTITWTRALSMYHCFVHQKRFWRTKPLRIDNCSVGYLIFGSPEHLLVAATPIPKKNMSAWADFN